jgi:hypothetical protein
MYLPESLSTLVANMFIFVVNFSFVIQNVSFGIRGVITKITLEILLSLVYMSSLEKKIN